jgi:ubiquinol-cytochrome c reductase cytochrome b subunit
VLLGLVVVHILALHDVGSSNPDGVDIKKLKDANGHPVDGVPFHPYYTVKDIVVAVVFLAIFCVIMFFVPDVGGYFLEHNNFIPADPLKTPEHIAPLWYFTPYYSILRAVPPLFNSQFPGVLAMGVAVLILFFLPWLDRSPVKSIRYRGPLYKSCLTAFVVVFLVLGYIGTAPTTVWGQFSVREGSLMDTLLDTKDIATWAARVCTIVYFLFFVLMPWYTARDKVKPVPERVTA